uniref:Knottin scorpion toxin-like domain-containing protein n=1 Tax=Aegilops tauschii TaxID=37682 RepID=M8D847_AEGTA
MALAFLVLIMLSGCTLPSCHAVVYHPYCVEMPRGCSIPYCMDECNRIERRPHSWFCNNIGQCCCYTL